jgi:outer membrane receptor protein involved in Fe transport
VPLLPYAQFRSLGAFAQVQLWPIQRLTLVLGVRGQDTRAATRPTPGLTLAPISHEDQTVIGALNASYRLTPELSLVGSVGRGFRSANLIERFFEGPTPEGNAYQVRTPDLKPEQSLSLDAGLRWWSGGLRVEAFWFRSDINDAIVIVARGDTIQGLPAYENRNVGKLRYTGVELSAEVPIALGIGFGGNYSHVGSRDRLDAANPIAASYADKVVGRLQYTQPAGRFWAAWVVRHNGEQKDLGLGQSPVGAVWPSFTVQELRGGLTLFHAGRTVHQVTLAVSNLANALYSEPTNASLFRPAPGRSAALTYRIGF